MSGVVAVAVAVGAGAVGARPAAAAFDFPLRHSFSLTPGLPGNGAKTPTSCYDSGGGGQYLCRLVYGYEQVGHAQDYRIPSDDALAYSSPYQRFGRTVVTKLGRQYEGCSRSGATWTCDYLVPRQVSRHHYARDGWVLHVFWRWLDHTGDQLSCASAIVGVWYGGPITLPVVKACKNGPMRP